MGMPSSLEYIKAESIGIGGSGLAGVGFVGGISQSALNNRGMYEPGRGFRAYGVGLGAGLAWGARANLHTHMQRLLILKQDP